MTSRIVQSACRVAGVLIAVHCAACSSDDADGGAAGAGGSAGSATAGMGSAGGSGGARASATPDCSDASDASASELHAAAAAVLLPGATNRCAFSSCHSESSAKAKLVLEDPSLDLHAALVDKPSCEAGNLKLVDGGGGDAALANSWLWQKLVAPADDAGGGDLVSDSSWGASGGCDQRGNSGYGTRMPQMGSADTLDASKLAAVRDWICGGAPGPQ